MFLKLESEIPIMIKEEKAVELERETVIEEAIEELESSVYLAWDKACRVWSPMNV